MSISVGSSNTNRLGRSLAACRCGWCLSGRSTPEVLRGLDTTRPVPGPGWSPRPLVLRPFGRLFTAAPGTLMSRSCNAVGCRTVVHFVQD